MRNSFLKLSNKGFFNSLKFHLFYIEYIFSGNLRQLIPLGKKRDSIKNSLSFPDVRGRHGPYSGHIRLASEPNVSTARRALVHTRGAAVPAEGEAASGAADQHYS